MVHRVRALGPRTPTSAAEQKREALTALWRLHVRNLQQSYGYHAEAIIKLEYRIQIRYKGCLGVIGERIIILESCRRAITGIAITIFPTLTQNILQRHRRKESSDQSRFQELSS